MNKTKYHFFEIGSNGKGYIDVRDGSLLYIYNLVPSESNSLKLSVDYIYDSKMPNTDYRFQVKITPEYDADNPNPFYQNSGKAKYEDDSRQWSIYDKNTNQKVLTFLHWAAMVGCDIGIESIYLNSVSGTYCSIEKNITAKLVNNISEPDGEITFFVYDSHKRITKIISTKGMGVEITYINDSVSSIKNTIYFNSITDATGIIPSAPITESSLYIDSDAGYTFTYQTNSTIKRDMKTNDYIQYNFYNKPNSQPTENQIMLDGLESEHFYKNGELINSTTYYRESTPTKFERIIYNYGLPNQSISQNYYDSQNLLTKESLECTFKQVEKGVEIGNTIYRKIQKDNYYTTINGQKYISIESIDDIGLSALGEQLYSNAYATTYTYDSEGNLASIEEYDGLKKNVISSDVQSGSKLKKLETAHDLTNEKIWQTCEVDFYDRLTKASDERGNNSNLYYKSNTNLVSSIEDPLNNKVEISRNNYNEATKISALITEDCVNENNISHNKEYLTALSSKTNYNFEYMSKDIQNMYKSKKVIKMDGNNYLTTTYVESGDTDVIVNAFGNDETFTTSSNSSGLITDYQQGNQNATPIKECLYDAQTGLTKTETDHLTGIVTNYSYDSNGQLIAMDNQEIKYAISTSIKGNISSEECTIKNQDIKHNYSFEYNTWNECIKIILPNHMDEIIQKDKLRRITEIGNSVNMLKFSYLTNLETIIEGSKQFYRSTNFVSNIKDKNDNILSEYKYDTRGNIEFVVKNNNTIRYYYDNLNRLIREDNPEFNRIYIFEYDNNGNILNKKEYQYTITSCEDLTPLKTFAYTYIGDKLSSFDDELCRNYALGNPSTYRNKSLSWSKVNNLDSFGDVNYKYNANGMRISKTTEKSTTKFYYAGSKLLMEEIGSTNAPYCRGDISSGEEICQNSQLIEYYYGAYGITGFKLNKGNVYYYLKNIQGDITHILNSSGTKIAEYIYDAWGNHKIFAIENDQKVDITDDSGYNDHVAKINPFRYRGYYFDNETGLYYLKTRYYDPQVGRFISMDSVDNLDPETINGLNLYAYCLNNPVMYFDPNGELAWFIPIIWAIVAIGVSNVAVHFLTDMSRYLQTGQWTSSWEDYVGAFLGGIAGGIVFFASFFNLSYTFGVMNGVETLATDILTNISGKTDYTFGQIAGRVFINTVLGFTTGKFFKGTKIPGLSKGRNSFMAVFKSGITKVKNKTASKIGLKVLLKGTIGFTALRAGVPISTFIMEGLKGAIIEE